MDSRPVTALRQHPQNAAIYGDRADAELVESVRAQGILTPLLITADGTVISGHRRLDAARRVGLAEVPVIVFPALDELGVLRALVESNRNRQKTNEQIAREYATLLDVEGKEARRRHTALAGRPPQETVQHVAPFTGKAREKAAAAVGVSHTTAQRAVEVVKAIDHLEANGQKKEAQALRMTLNHSVGRAHHAAREAGQLSPQVQTAATPGEELVDSIITLAGWQKLPQAMRSYALSQTPSATFRFTQQRTQHIEWAQFSWNPVTGCLHDCSFCYARDIAMRLYPQKFEPTFLPERLGAPANTPLPIEAATNIGYRNVFTCSMADLFGRWVPSEWIEAVLTQVRANPQWNFLFLTKFPLRMAEFDYPENAWLGTSVDAQARIPNAEKAMAKVRAAVKWLSCEPMLERLTFTRLEMFQWLVIGGASASSQTPEFRPPREWVEHLEGQARVAGCRVYEKTNLLDRIRDYPGQAPAAPVNVPAEFKMGYLQRDVTG